MRFSPPDSRSTVRTRPDRRKRAGGCSPWRTGGRHGPEVLADTNDLLAARPRWTSPTRDDRAPRRRAARGPPRGRGRAVGHPGLGRDRARPLPAVLTTEPSGRPSSPITGPLSETEAGGRGVGAPSGGAARAAHAPAAGRPGGVATATPTAPRALPHIAARPECPPAPARPARTEAPPAVVPAARTPEGSPWDVGAWDGWWAPRRPTRTAPRPPAHPPPRRPPSRCPRAAPPRAADAPGGAAAGPGARRRVGRHRPRGHGRAGRRERAHPLPGRARLREHRRSAMTRTTGRLDWLLSDFARGTPGVDTSSWSPPTGCGSRSPGSTSTSATRCAAASGLVSLARGTATLLERQRGADHRRDGGRLPVRDVDQPRARRWWSPTAGPTWGSSATR